MNNKWNIIGTIPSLYFIKSHASISIVQEFFFIPTLDGKRPFLCDFFLMILINILSFSPSKPFKSHETNLFQLLNKKGGNLILKMLPYLLSHENYLPNYCH